MRKMADVSTIFTALFIFVIVAFILARIIKITISSSWYKRNSAERQNRYAKLTRVIFQPVRRKLFADLDDHLKRMNGDVLEIGIGSGQNLDDYPQGTSLIAVDLNPHVEKLLRENLGEAGNRVHLKKFVVASAEDMSSMGKVGVEDNSVAAVVCMKLLCSLNDEQITKTVREVKRILMPGGRFFFMEHIIGKSWTLQYILQQLFSKSQLWPTLYNGCRCDRETLNWIKQGGFKMVQAEKRWLNWTPTIIIGSKSIPLSWHVRCLLYFVSSMLVGFAEKEQCTEEKKQL